MYSSNGLYLGGYFDARAINERLERQRNCRHETACMLPPDMHPDRYQCNDCGMRVESLDVLRRLAAPESTQGNGNP